MKRLVPALDVGAEFASALLQLVDDAVLVLDPDGTIRGSSRGIESLLDRQADDLLGTRSSELLPEQDRAAFLQRLRDLGCGKAPEAFDTTLWTQSGDLRAVQALLTRVEGSSGRLSLILCTLQLIDRPYFLSDFSPEQMLHLWTLLDTVPIGITYVDTSRRVRYVNKEGLRNVSDGRSSVIGMHMRDVFGAELYQSLAPQIDLVLAGEESTSEVTLTRSDGTCHHFFRHLYPHKTADNVVLGYFSILVDISESKGIQEAQLQHEHLLRSTLIREINHRVKNSLQGLIGIMRMYEARQSQPTPLMDQCVSQLMAVAISFGLASRHKDARILLCEMVRDIAASVEQVSQCKVDVQLFPGVANAPVSLSEQHSANVSLVVNELVFNAVKHSASPSGQDAICVQVDRHDGCAFLRVINGTGVLPGGFSYSEGIGLGTGLNLVKVLIPPGAGALSISQEAAGVVAELRLKYPVLADNLVVAAYK